MSDGHRFSGRPEEDRPAERRGPDTPLAAVPDEPEEGRRVEPLRLSPLLPRRQHPWLVVDVDGTPSGYGALVWALREAARREATVVAVCVLDDAGPDPFTRSTRREWTAAEERLEAHVLRAIAETGVVGRARTAVLERPVFEALTGAARGADLVVVGAHGKTLLRPAVPRPHVRRVARGA
ncbi:universal stress protein [Geodermatophilus sp. SYSU D01105]